MPVGTRFSRLLGRCNKFVRNNGWDWTYHADRESYIWLPIQWLMVTVRWQVGSMGVAARILNRNSNPSAAASFVNVKGLLVMNKSCDTRFVWKTDSLRSRCGAWATLGSTSEWSVARSRRAQCRWRHGNDRITIRSKGYVDAARAHDISIVLLGGEGNDILTGGLGDRLSLMAAPSG